MSKIKLRRRELYKQLPVDKKELLLSQRRLKELESNKQHVLIDYTEEESLFQAGANLRKQRTLTINEPSSVGNKVDISAFDGEAIDSKKEKNVTGYLSVFELGSTSGVPCEGHDAEPSADKNKGFPQFLSYKDIHFYSFYRNNIICYLS
ncbi:hypothetical protein A4A49_24722 [Nicotiana attenuata]|uniref:Uncharacterized protein n=1 Tax=Nicotiana attenuata TaxID=49451 RepID=A0A1J6IZP4_NICAT|nr:hypothetical protein A4A49_24722 [Nicotiana attenuata]